MKLPTGGLRESCQSLIYSRVHHVLLCRNSTRVQICTHTLNLWMLK